MNIKSLEKIITKVYGLTEKDINELTSEQSKEIIKTLLESYIDSLRKSGKIESKVLNELLAQIFEMIFELLERIINLETKKHEKIIKTKKQEKTNEKINIYS